MDLINIVSEKINKYKPSKIQFNELWDSKPTYKVYLQYKQLFLSKVQDYYEVIDLQDESVDIVKGSIDFNELLLLFLSAHYSKTLDWRVLSKNYKISFADYVNCYNALAQPQYTEFEAYLQQFNITDVNEILSELKTL